MLVCAIDGHANSLDLVLTVLTEDRVPRLLEGRRLPLPASAASLRAVFQQWLDFYRVEVDLVVCNAADALPSELLEALHAVTGRVDWVEQDQVDAVLAAWKETVPQARWLRGTMMALLASVPPPPHADSLEADHCRAGYCWLQAWFCSHLEELERRNSVCEPADEPGAWLDECPF